MTPGEIVTAFIQAIERREIGEAVAMLSEDISYENMPMAPVKGRDSVAATLQGFIAGASEVDWPCSSQYEVGNVVFNERLDRFKVGSGWLELPVAGIFHVGDDGLITLWRDYFDLSTYMRQMKELGVHG
ncbi:MAG: limonene-1,2-epoxide hydrolase family protein [Actinomycetota bacterium]